VEISSTACGKAGEEKQAKLMEKVERVFVERLKLMRKYLGRSTNKIEGQGWK
jgi:hypothetical protein